MTARKVPKPPGPGATEVMSTGHRPDLAAIDPEPLNEDERRWRAYVTREMAEKELESLAHELAGVEALERGLTASAVAMHAAADEAEAELGPASARHLRDQAVEVERRRELTTRRVKHIREQIAWRKKALKC